MATIPKEPADGIYEAYSHTTYRDNYRPYHILPPIKYFQPPAFELVEGVKHVQKREFPLIPAGPHRRLEIDIAPTLGVGSKDVNTERYLDPKPIIKTQPPKTIINIPVVLLKKRRGSARKSKHLPHVGHEIFQIGDGVLVDSMCDKSSWTTTTQQANTEATRPTATVEPPMSTFEENADMIKLRPKRYETQAEMWQTVASVWERAQSRHHTERWRSDDYIQGSKPQGQKIINRKSNTVDAIIVDARIKELVQNNKVNSAYERHCPGYAGFVPRSPIDAPLEAQQKKPPLTVMKASYRELPVEEYNIQKYAHEGPLSQLLTLTSPYNPFNKLRKLKY